MAVNELEWLAYHAKKSNLIVEIGSYKGRSTVVLADNCDGIVYAVDTWGDENNGAPFNGIDVYNEFLVNLKNYKNVISFKGTFEDFIKALSVQPDFVFIDADHSYESVKKDIINAKSILVPNGIISGHDYGYADWPGVKRAVDEVLGEVAHLNSIWWRYV